MGLWPFGRAKADVESASRVVVLRARDGVPMRAKVTLRLEEPQTQATADELAERCADLVRLVVREAPSATAVLGLEGAIANEVVARLSKEQVALRGVEIAGLHIVGDPGHVARPTTAPNENPAWLHAAPSMDRGLDRPTPIHPVPSSRPLSSGVPASAQHAPPSSLGHAPASSGAAGHAPARPLDPYASTAVSPSPFAQEAAGPEASPPAPTPHMGIPAVAKPHAPAREPAPTPHMGIPVIAKSHAPAREPEPTPHMGIPVVAKSHAPAREPAPTPHMGIPVIGKSHAPTREPEPTPHMGIPAVAKNHPGPHHAHAAEPAAHGAARPHEPFASTAVSAAPPLDAAGRVRTDSVAPAHGRPPSVVPPAYGRPSSVAPPAHGRSPSAPPPTFSPVSHAPSSVAPRSRPSSGSMRAVDPGSHPLSGSMSALDEHSSASRRGSALPPPSAGPASIGPNSRGSNRPPPGAVAARRRVVAARLPLPTGAGPYEVARGLTPLFRDTAARILVAFLRMYDLAVVRRVPFDAVEGDILASLTAPSDGAPGTYAASHAAEIQRWRDGFGAATMEKLQREANTAALALAFQGFVAEGVSQRTSNAVVEGLAGSAFGDPDMIIDLGRYLYPARETTAAETLANMIDVAGEGMPPGLESAMEPLFASLREDVAAAALIARDVMTSV